MKTISILFAALLSQPLSAAEISIDQGYLRATPPGQMMSSAYMTLINNSAEKVTLTGGLSDQLTAIEIHDHAMVDGVMSMKHIKALSIEPGERVKLAPGGLHIMFIGLKKPLVEGEMFNFDITFKDGSQQKLELPIKSIVN